MKELPGCSRQIINFDSYSSTWVSKHVNSVEPKCQVFEHSESKARVLLPLNKDEEPAREADVISIRTHLMYRGHLDQAGFEQFLKEGVLRAS